MLLAHVIVFVYTRARFLLFSNAEKPAPLRPGQNWVLKLAILWEASTDIQCLKYENMGGKLRHKLQQNP